MKIGIVAFPGSTGEKDIQAAALMVGFQTQDVTIVDHRQTDLAKFDVVFLPGGASYGDSVRPGAVAKLDPVAEALIAFAASGKTLIGIGNGFQILTELHLLPGGFIKNKHLKTLNGLYQITVQNNQTILTNAYEKDQTITLPISHKYGQYVLNESELKAVQANNQILFTYQHNLNGSVADIAGMTNEAGNVFGLMAKPERAMEQLLGSKDGRLLFESLYQHANRA